MIKLDIITSLQLMIIEKRKHDHSSVQHIEPPTQSFNDDADSYPSETSDKDVDEFVPAKTSLRRIRNEKNTEGCDEIKASTTARPIKRSKTFLFIAEICD